MKIAVLLLLFLSFTDAFYPVRERLRERLQERIKNQVWKRFLDRRSPAQFTLSKFLQDRLGNEGPGEARRGEGPRGGERRW